MKFKVKRIDNWIEVYLPRLDKRRHKTFILGFVEDSKLVITDAYVSPSLRGKGVGKRLVERLKKEASKDIIRVNNIQPSAVGFWENMGLEEETDARKYKRIDRIRDRYFKEEGPVYK